MSNYNYPIPSEDYTPPREIPRRKQINAGIAQTKFRRAVLEAAAEIATEFTDHYWKHVIQNQAEQPKPNQPVPKLPPPTSNETLKQGFIFYLNTSGRYQVLREHLRQAVGHMIQQRCLNLRPSAFETHRDFQAFLLDLYIYLVDEVHESLNRTSLQEIDPLDPPKGICNPDSSPESLSELETKTLLRKLLFYSEEAFAQGDFDTCHKIHLQRICRSKESPSCWIDFAIMWLSRGDDRMAEIAVREALRRDPNDFYALLIGGLIAITHNDERGIGVLAAALNLKPISPEILVIMAVANVSISSKNEVDSDYFFNKATYLHRVLTGQEIGNLEEILGELSRTVGVAESTQNLTNAEALLNKDPDTLVEIPVISAGKRASQFSIAGSTKSIAKNKSEIQDKTTSKMSTTPDNLNSKKKSNAQDNTTAENDNPEAGDREKLGSPSKKITESLMVFTSHTEANVGAPDQPQPQPGDTMDPKNEEMSGDANANAQRESDNNNEYQPIVDFTPELKRISFENAILPPLRPSMHIPCNITNYSDKLKELLLQEKRDRSEYTAPEVGTDEVIKAEDDKITPGQDQESESSQNAVDQPKKQSINSTLEEHEYEVQVNHASVQTEAPLSENAPLVEIADSVIDAPVEKVSLPLTINRLGSELIWAGQLLLELKMFDILDEALARELRITGKRSLQFLYLRAMSLYLRQCQKEAIPLLEEAITIDPENPVFWIVKGHCHYELGDTPEATESYETALRLPVGKENRHLLYLRFGTLSLDAGNYDTAKRVFLYGIQKYPTPYMWLAAGNTCYNMGDYDQAEAAFTEANHLDNTNPITWAHLALLNLATDRQSLAEESYKWAMRLGLKKGKFLDEINRLQQEKGLDDPSFPRLSNCIPHEYYVRRLGRQKPFDIYRDALINDTPTMGKNRFDNTERENALREKLLGKSELPLAQVKIALDSELTEKCPSGEPQGPEGGSPGSPDGNGPDPTNSEVPEKTKSPQKPKKSTNKLAGNVKSPPKVNPLSDKTEDAPNPVSAGKSIRKSGAKQGRPSNVSSKKLSMPAEAIKKQVANSGSETKKVEKAKVIEKAEPVPVEEATKPSN